MKVTTGKAGEDTCLLLKEIYSNTILETAEGNQLAICMRDDTIEMSVVGKDKWFRVDIETGLIEAMSPSDTEKDAQECTDFGKAGAELNTKYLEVCSCPDQCSKRRRESNIVKLLNYAEELDW